MICGIVLSAGQSRRMGEPKALLRAGGETFLARAVLALRQGGCDPVVVVTGPDEDAGARAIQAEARALGASVAVNPDPRSEQLDSLRIGLRALPDEAEGAAVSPVDIPDLSAGVVRRLVDALRRTGAPIAVPVRDGKHGHPVLFGRAVFGELSAPGLPDGARTVIHAHAAELAEVSVDALPADLDTPEELRRWREGA
ncbi:MAG TPA: nucleotidyltransferase family protein [Longimicrobium sp.]|jgi:nicotine blue oxidoreductase|uniref:nucleotidyltransferase family protein n=1 Tax=Longimicrobium sp. TaxID=2029185 RepID=UPI002ED87441